MVLNENEPQPREEEGLESRVRALEERLDNAEKEIRRLRLGLLCGRPVDGV